MTLPLWLPRSMTWRIATWIGPEFSWSVFPRVRWHVSTVDPVKSLDQTVK
jgi:hypothetical protein